MKPRHLEQAAEEVKSKRAIREIRVARVAIKKLAKQMKTLDIDDTTILDAIAICKGNKAYSVAQRLERILESRDK